MEKIRIRVPAYHGRILSFLRNKRVVSAVSACVFLVLVFNIHTAFSSDNTLSYLSSIRDATTDFFPTGSRPKSATFWPSFYAALIAATPRSNLPHYGMYAPNNHYRPWGDNTVRPNLVRLDLLDEQELKDAHSWFVAQILDESFPKPYFVPGSSGVVTTAGGKWFPETLVAIRMLRKTGSTLPVDVFLATPEEQEGNLCQTVLPLLNARCRILSDLVELHWGLPHRLDVSHYQLKAFALLLSEFDNILWMDADQIPLIDPRPLLEEDGPLQSTGLVTWPDFWGETMSPVFFRVASMKDTPPTQSSRAASETGQLLVSKSLALPALELATYYNFHGPSHYYMLVTQGAWGMGDKDTFLAAAMALDAPYYDVKTPVQTIGYYHEDNVWDPQAILQAHPVIDELRYGNGSNHTGFDFSADEDHFPLNSFERVPPIFLHSQQNKPNAGYIAGSFRGRTPYRKYRPLEEIVSGFGFDIERSIWDEIIWTVCGEELDAYVFSDWIDNELVRLDQANENGGLCKEMKDIYAVLFEGAEPKLPATDDSGDTASTDDESSGDFVQFDDKEESNEEDSNNEAQPNGDSAALDLSEPVTVTTTLPGMFDDENNSVTITYKVSVKPASSEPEPNIVVLPPARPDRHMPPQRRPNTDTS